MHLPNGEPTIRFGEIPKERVEKVYSNGTLDTQQNGTYSNGCAPTNRHVSDSNEVDIYVPKDLPQDSILDTVLAAWIVLIQRYQRDVFHQFTWGAKDAEKDKIQCISAGDLDSPSHETCDSLTTKLRNLRLRNISGDETTIFLNDGTSEEWSFEVSLKFTRGSLQAVSRWQAPNLSGHQAVSQLHFFVSILDTLFSEPEHPISNFLAVSENELEEIWNWNTPMPPDLRICMHEMVSEQAQNKPEKTAIEAWDGSLTYRQVDDYSTHLAQNLRLLDDSEKQIIPVLFEKCRWTVVAVLAVMKAGACFALLDPAQPEGRLRTVVQQINASLLIASKTQATLGARIAPSATIIPIAESKFDKIHGPYAEQQPKTTLPTVSPSAALYIQFTSGSTGLPKGCIISHSQYTSGAMPRAYDVGYRSHSRVLDFASYAFDVCIDSMLCTLAHGGTLCTPSEDRRMNDLSGAMRDMRVTLAGMTPSVARTLDVDILDHLDSIALGGEGVSASDAATWGQRTKVVNAYGPSECTVGATINADVGAKPYITMGKGKGCAVWLTEPNNHNKLVPIGAVGELLIEGPIVGDGYLNNPAKTKEVFIEDPEFLIQGSKTMPGRHGRMYKSGDLVRYDPDGNGEVIFVGRQDQQVKLRGQRIELAEIEYNMQKHLPSDTQLAAEVIKPGGTGEPTLVAFLVEQKKSGMRHLDGNVFGSFSNKFQTALQEMTKELFKNLPGYMVPSAYIPLWKMPLLVSCKTDRKRLREVGVSVTRQDLRRFNAIMSEKKEPTTEMELKLGQLWAQVLGGDADFSANDNFFSMGGDSLRAMKLVAAARADGVILTVPDIMMNSTLSAMAAKTKPLSGEEDSEILPFALIPKDWDMEKARDESAELCGIDASLVEDVYSCTPLQEGLMALSAKFPDAYVAQRVVTLPVEAAEKLKRAYDTTVEDSPVLRTRMINVPGRGLFQVVLKDGLLVRDHGTDLSEYLKLDREEPMDLGKALFRYGVVREPQSDKAHFVISMHHAIYDGWSMPLVFERINRAFNGLKTIRPTTFKHFIKYLTNLDPSETKSYWKERLDGANPYQFPPLPQKGYITQADSLLEHYVNVPTSAHSRLTLATIIRGAWALVSSLYMGHPDIIFGETTTGRSAPVHGIEEIEGPMITTIPVRVRLNLDRPISEFLQTVHAQTVQQIPHEHLGLQNIRRLSKDARGACELRTGLVLNPKEEENFGEETFEHAPANAFLPADDAEAAREALKFNTYALMLVCTLDENGFLIMASFDSKCITSPAMEKVLVVLDRIVTAFLGNPESKLGDIAVLDPEEEQDALRLRPTDMMTDSAIQMSPSNGYTPGNTPAQALSANGEKLRSLLSRILGMPETDIKPEDSFFELGGDSISAMRLVPEARAQGLNITVAQIFQSSSLFELAASIGNEKEDKLLDLLSRILGMPKSDISPNDSFFELGGDSISAMRLVPEARAQGLNITVAQVFQSKSLSELASAAEESSSTQSEIKVDAPFVALGADASLFSADRMCAYLENPEWEIANIYPTRPLQQLAVEGTVDLPRYSLRYELMKFATAIDRQKLAQACQELVARNEVLRTVFVQDDRKTLGVVISSLQVPYCEVAVADDDDVDTYAKTYIQKDIEAPKPYGSSFIAFTLFTSTSGASTLVFRISHAQYDEICLPLLFDQLSALYADTAVPETVAFSKHVNHVVLNNIPQSIPYWQQLLSNSQMSVLKPDIPLTHRKAADIYLEFDISSRPQNITIGSLPTAAWAIVLARRLNIKDVVFGEVVTGRNIGAPSADRIFGPTWQYIPFRVPFKSGWTHLDLLNFVQKQHIESAAYEGMGLAEIVENCTTWDPKEVTWFDTVVHQAPQWVEELPFGSGVEAKFETLYPHAEPLREWKCQAFVKDGGKKLGIEIVTFEEWIPVAKEVLQEVGKALGSLMAGKVGERIFEDVDEVSREVKEPTLEDFEGVM
ncbi:nonribosomal peptide synthetase 6 [Dothidotthia symphoricarpi CBS 119687]|uniref:Nonribosomal peptide synthetase 6 n=1 Tax=Dothidotthia symphoricarpi CBS 119687 TaxID=1392245 RepID=A0A6A6AGY7_9PLEO|nr:nonribosomal peptide synthetase 6 [Dothidotthia symphoricarpi CBS 119687]KAF2130328.1 nonribosomal peptide synthetase 6 [Dothidotthia symphoricarpi CBS 119687]